MFGPVMAACFGVVCCTQFHLLFYMSRTLPNVFALTLVLLGLSMWLQERYTRMFFLFTFTAVVFRFEVVLLLAPLTLDALLRKRVRFFWVVWCGVVFGLLSLAVSVTLDSVLWNRLIWPEGSGLLFNVVQNKSSLYGVSPWHYYFSSALPRALLGSLPLVMLGLLLQPRVRRVVIPAIFLVCAFSFLPHKELRFVIYAVPLLNVAAAGVIESAWRRGNKFVLFLIFVLLLASVAASGVMAAASRANYPGGEALATLHSLRGERGLPGTSVWLSNLACQTGVTRFGQLRPDWLYSKAPNVESYADFTFVISEDASLQGFREIALVQTFDHIRKWPFAIVTRPALRVFENLL
jgi:alpha-1,6-mannosyltransferase